MRALIAARKSSRVATGEGMSLDTQDANARTFCVQQGWEVIGACRDTISGTVAPMHRKELSEWLAKPWAFDAIVVWETDRLSRGTQADWTAIEHWADENGKTLVVANGDFRYPARDDADFYRWMTDIRGARREWEKYQERTTRSQNALYAKGAVMGRAPFGYRIAGELYSKRFEINEPEAKLVREAFQMAADGKSLRVIGDYLKANSKWSWSPENVKRLLSNWTYAGRIERKGQPYATCDPIVTADDLARAAVAMKSRNKKPNGGRPSANPALVTLKCGTCGKSMYRTHGRYYHQAGQGQECGFSQGVPYAPVEAGIREAVTKSTEPEMAEKLIRGKRVQGERNRIMKDQQAALARQDVDTIIALKAELEALPEQDEPNLVEYVPTGRTVGEAMAALPDAELRERLKAWEVIAHPGGMLEIRTPWQDVTAPEPL